MINDFSDTYYKDFLGVHLGKSHTSGGKKWSKNEAKKYAKQVAPKYEHIKRVIAKIKTYHSSDFPSPRQQDMFRTLLAQTRVNEKQIEYYYKNFKIYEKKGWDNSDNRKKGQIVYKKILALENWAKMYERKTKNWAKTSFAEKSFHTFKKLNFALPRQVGLFAIKMNVLNFASIFKLAKMRRPDKYKKVLDIWSRVAAGKKSSFDKQVEIGYKKKPIGAKKMKVNWDKEIKKNADGKNNTTKTVLTISGGILAAFTGIIAAISPPDPPEKAGWTGAAAGVSGVLGALISAINGAIPMQPEEDDKVKSAEVTPDDVNNARNNSLPQEDWITGVPNWVTAAGGGLVLGGIIFAIIKISKS